jgi:hypothetical protein
MIVFTMLGALVLVLTGGWWLECRACYAAERRAQDAEYELWKLRRQQQACAAGDVLYPLRCRPAPGFERWN